MTDLKHLISRQAQQPCPQGYVIALTDTLNVLKGKWKLPIIMSLLRGNERFKDLQNAIEDITPRMLSKELKELEMNNIVLRTTSERSSGLSRYELTPSGKSLVELVDAMIDWGLSHRQHVFLKEVNTP